MNTVQLYNWQNVHMHVLLLESNAKAFLKHHSLLALEVIIIRRPSASFGHVGCLRLRHGGRVVILVGWVPLRLPAVVHLGLVGASSWTSCSPSPRATRATPLISWICIFCIGLPAFNIETVGVRVINTVPQTTGPCLRNEQVR